MSGTTRNGGQGQTEAVLWLRESGAVQSPVAGEAPIRKDTRMGLRIVAGRFAAGDADGWITLNEDGTADATRDFEVATNETTSWLRACNVANSKLWGWCAPEKFLGDHSDKFGGILTYGVWADTSDLPANDVYVRLNGGGKSIFVDGTTLRRKEAGQWNNYTVRLDSSGGRKLKNPKGLRAKATDGEIKQVLSRMTGLWIKGEYANNADSGGLVHPLLVGRP